MENKYATVDKAASMNIVEGFFDAYRKQDLDKMVAHRNPEGELRYVLLETKARVRLVLVAGQSGADYSTPRLI
jgi:hypothetical protein